MSRDDFLERKSKKNKTFRYVTSKDQIGNFVSETIENSHKTDTWDNTKEGVWYRIKVIPSLRSSLCKYLETIGRTEVSWHGDCYSVVAFEDDFYIISFK